MRVTCSWRKEVFRNEVYIQAWTYWLWILVLYVSWQLTSTSEFPLWSNAYHGIFRGKIAYMNCGLWSKILTVSFILRKTTFVFHTNVENIRHLSSSRVVLVANTHASCVTPKSALASRARYKRRLLGSTGVHWGRLGRSKGCLKNS